MSQIAGLLVLAKSLVANRHYSSRVHPKTKRLSKHNWRYFNETYIKSSFYFDKKL